MAVSKRLRYEILRRDNHTCRYCGATAPNVPLRVDHVTPVALGGTDTPDNLVTSCEPCNSGKSSATVDSALVADVAQDALRWADAMKQAAASLLEQEQPKLKYQNAFLAEWNRWGKGKGANREAVALPGDWKPSLERFRTSGLPAWVWGDIVDTSMGYDKVIAANKFKYCCGIAWNMVAELQDEARRIVGATPKPGPKPGDAAAAVREAAFAVWRCGLIENGEAPTLEQEQEFRRSLDALTSEVRETPGRIINAAEQATYFGITDISTALRDLDHSDVWQAWVNAWPSEWISDGDPDNPWKGKVVGGAGDGQRAWFKEQLEKLLDADVYVTRLIRAAAHAGTHKSARLYLGLSDEELAHTGVSSWMSRTSEIWRVAYMAAGGAEPTEGQSAKLYASLVRIIEDGGFLLADVYEAAASAGSYKDPDLTTCLTRDGSVFKAAALPVGGER
ncbi:HNH endonuclease [Streptomyces xanthochromogenes]|uniref:HNH endonuclease n=1 Tax=Streptomyces xanthochromogenes TaxID=67384 RepID=UPI003827233D